MGNLVIAGVCAYIAIGYVLAGWAIGASGKSKERLDLVRLFIVVMLWPAVLLMGIGSAIGGGGK